MQSSIGRKASYVVVLPSSPEIELILLISVRSIRILVMGVCSIRILYTNASKWVLTYTYSK